MIPVLHGVIIKGGKVKVRDLSPFGLRIRPDLKEWFVAYSRKDKRSMTYSINEAMEFFKQHKEEEKNANI